MHFTQTPLGLPVGWSQYAVARNLLWFEKIMDMIKDVEAAAHELAYIQRV
jgi:hypothetical protein